MRKAISAMAVVLAVVLTTAGSCEGKGLRIITVVNPGSAACTPSEVKEGKTVGVSYEERNRETGAVQNAGIQCFTPAEVQRRNLVVGGEM